MPTFPAYKTKPYYDPLKAWLTTSLNEDGTLRSDAVQAEVSAALADNQTVVDAAAAAVDATPVISELTPAAGKIVTGNPDGDPVAQEFGGSFLPLRNVTMTPRVSGDVLPIDAIGGTLYGRGRTTSTNVLYRSTDDGLTWETVGTVTGASSLTAVRQLGNGEVVVLSGGSGLFTSTGWATNPLTATWTLRATPTQTTGADPSAAFLPLNLDVYDKYVLVGEYVNPKTNAHMLRFSQDYGVTFTDLLDLKVLYPAFEDQNTHWHGCAIDPWADTVSGVRLWAIHGDGPRSIRYSDDLGSTWTIFNEGDWQFTTISATPAGMVCSTDEAPDGVYRILRTDDPADMVLEPMHLVRIGITASLYGFAMRSFYHAPTGITYIAFNSNWAGVPSFIFASDGYHADEVWRSPVLPSGGSECQNVSVVDGGGVHWQWIDKITGDTYHVEADQVARGGHSITEAFSHLFGGTGLKDSIALGHGLDLEEATVAIGENVSIGSRAVYSVVMGEGATTDANAVYTVVIGNEARARSNSSVVIGQAADAEGDGAVLVGRSTKGYANAVVIGSDATSRGADATSQGVAGVVIGKGASNISTGGGVAIGWLAKVMAAPGSGLAIGYDAQTSADSAVAIGTSSRGAGFRATAIGRSANAAASYATAIGLSATATHQGSVALGYNSVTSANDQASLGARHLELAEVPDPGVPAANTGRLYFRDNGAGKTQLVVQFPTGAAQVIATEP